MKMRCDIILIACVATMSAGTLPARAQVSEGRDNGLIERAVTEGCAPRKMNDILRKTSFDDMADWLSTTGHPTEARRIRSLSVSEAALFGLLEPEVSRAIARLVENTGKGGDWDAAKNLSTAAVLLGGTDGLIRYLAAARDLHLAVHAAPAAYLYENQGGVLANWVSEARPLPQTTPLPTGVNALETKAAFEIPYRVGLYLRGGQDYALPVNPEPATVVYVNTAAFRAMEDTRDRESHRIADTATIPLRQTLAGKLAKPQDNQAAPTDDADRALTFAAWLPRICLNYQMIFTPALVSRKVINENYIDGLKAKSAW